MIAVFIEPSYNELFSIVLPGEFISYEPRVPEHRRIMYECACLQWSMGAKALNEHIRIYGPYYCAVRQGRVAEVYKMKAMTPFLTMQEALDARLIYPTEDGTYIVEGFQFRRIGLLTVDRYMGVAPDRKFFYKSTLAEEEVRRRWIGWVEDINQRGFTYIKRMP